MSWRPFGTKVKISKIFFLLLALAVLKLTLLGSIGVEKMTHTLFQAIAPVAGVEEAYAQDAMEDATEDAVEKSIAQEAEAEAAMDENAAMEEVVMTTKPDGMDESDWKVLKKREEELAAKERSLKELEAQLNTQLAEIEKRNTQLKNLLDEVKGVKDERLQKLIKAYANMKAKSAAAVLETMNQNLAVKILSGLGGRQAGEVLGFIETRKAAQLSEALTNLRAPFEQE